MTESRLARNDGKIVVVARSEASAERRGNLAKSLSDGREGLPCRLARNDGKIIVVARSKASAKRRSNLAKSLSDGREGLPRLLARNDGRKMSRNDGKIVVVARSEASAERRDNLSSLSFRLSHHRWQSRKLSSSTWLPCVVPSLTGDPVLSGFPLSRE